MCYKQILRSLEHGTAVVPNGIQHAPAAIAVVSKGEGAYPLPLSKESSPAVMLFKSATVFELAQNRRALCRAVRPNTGSSGAELH